MIMGSTPIFGIPYVEPTGKLAEYPAADKAQADKLEASLGGKPYCEASATAVQSTASGSETTIVYQSSYQSPTGMFTNGGSDITIPVAGMYLILLGYSWAASTAGSRIVILRINGTTNRSWNVGGAGSPGNITGNMPVIKNLTAGMTVRMAQYQSSGAALNTFNQSYPTLTVTRLGPGL